mmetsp:Transcript_69/g.190  ORF Transcript_69/g.190 Transcript_69/m.190 type:complete len:400 (-) Transcript_69:71-1270(-)
MDESCRSNSPALSLNVDAADGKARATTMRLPHFTAETPMFMPVGTQGTVKGLTTEQLVDANAQVILGNTYHLALRPGGDVMESMGGLHEFMNWPRGILTDSGGFQMVSLLRFSEITEEGVRFQSPVDGTDMLLTPERSIELQNQIGADIIMALDDVVSSTTTGPRVEEAMHRTLRWIDRCIAAHRRKDEQNLFGIVQGGLDPKLRDVCLDAMVERDLPGYAVGGLSGGEKKELFWRIVDQCTDKLPRNKPRYCMGVGYPVDLMVCVALGVDMFDCVYPARTARFGTALIKTGLLRLKTASMATDFQPLDPSCKCSVCKTYTRAYIHSLNPREGSVGAQLVTLHNIAYLTNLMAEARQAILDGRFSAFIREFMKLQYPKGDYPQWVVEALAKVDITLTTN